MKPSIYVGLDYISVHIVDFIWVEKLSTHEEVNIYNIKSMYFLFQDFNN